jgi:hypothetical protein
MKKKNIFCILKINKKEVGTGDGTDQEPDPDPLVKGTDTGIWTKMSRIPNTGQDPLVRSTDTDHSLFS